MFHIIYKYTNPLKRFYKWIIRRKKIFKAFKKEIVQFLINTDSTLKSTYECYQGIINSLKDKDFNKFKSIVKHQNKNISLKMKQALKLYDENIK